MEITGYIEINLFDLLDSINDAVEECKWDMGLAEVNGVHTREEYEKTLSILGEMRTHVAAIENLYNSLPDIF